MITLRKGFKNKNYFLILFISLTILIGQVNSEGKIIAKKGDTLLKISNEYGVSLKELMHKNDMNDANKIVEGEVIFIPENNSNNKNTEVVIHTITEGDTLYKIARIYNIKVKDITNLNKLNDTSYLKLGQTIILPKKSFKNKKEQTLSIAKKKVNYHQISENESISDISHIHNVPIEDIVNINKIDNEIDLQVGGKLKIRDVKKKSNKQWLNYGPLKVNWSDWRYFKGSYITTARNMKDKSFFLAINCEKKRINHTLKNGKWNKWFFPKNDFEHNLINNFCD